MSKITNDAVWHRLLYMATVGVKGLTTGRVTADHVTCVCDVSADVSSYKSSISTNVIVTSDGNVTWPWRQRHVAVDDDISQLVQHQRQVFPVRRAELFHEVRLVDVRRLSGPLIGFQSRHASTMYTPEA